MGLKEVSTTIIKRRLFLRDESGTHHHLVQRRGDQKGRRPVVFPGKESKEVVAKSELSGLTLFPS